ncbi:dual specificity protein phosphatase MPK-4 [Zeugodacus cucurbitae]|uniref:dual specificity protein phosphatase MPK-4 n=1 Tax=Zeugodacus cucurbitae TaxID=28588 RepID=UPI0023D9242F|nr:dual specificity protein phosphatase MPK-4 [Zeugodacus cucurbitae]
MQVERNLAQAQTIATSTQATDNTTGATVATGVTVKCATIANVSRNQRRLQDVGTLRREDFDGGPVSVDEIVPGLYLGNLTAATHMETLKKFQITHILTLDSVPLPQHITQASFLTTKYVHIADMPKEDILHHLDTCTDFINMAMAQKGRVLVHCYFGVSRSSAVVIAFIMKQHDLEYQAAFELVRSKRRFVQPNPGFVSQLKLYRRMGCKIEPQFQRYKLYRLRLAGEQVRKAKILPQSFNSLIKSDPAVTQENPEPIVYRCRKCRRVLVSKSHVLLHNNKSLVATSSPPAATKPSGNNNAAAVEPQAPRLLDQIAAQIRKASLGSPTGAAAAEGEGDAANEQLPTVCRNILFVEPISWMRDISHSTQGRLHCPKCDQKVGNFSWINGCQCPCGEEVSPAFYLIPSRVELSKAVQNVQTTL